MASQSTAQMVMSTLYGGGTTTLHQARDPEEGEEGFDRFVAFGEIRFVNYNNLPLKIARATLTLDHPDLHLIDFAPVSNSDTSVWRLRFWGGANFNTYRGRMQVPGYATQLVSIALDRAVKEQPMLAENVIGLSGGVEYKLVGLVGTEIATVQGMVGI